MIEAGAESALLLPEASRRPKEDCFLPLNLLSLSLISFLLASLSLGREETVLPVTMVEGVLEWSPTRRTEL